MFKSSKTYYSLRIRLHANWRVEGWLFWRRYGYFVQRSGYGTHTQFGLLQHQTRERETCTKNKAYHVYFALTSFSKFFDILIQKFCSILPRSSTLRFFDQLYFSSYRGCLWLLEQFSQPLLVPILLMGLVPSSGLTFLQRLSRRPPQSCPQQRLMIHVQTSNPMIICLSWQCTSSCPCCHTLCETIGGMAEKVHISPIQTIGNFSRKLRKAFCAVSSLLAAPVLRGQK